MASADSGDVRAFYAALGIRLPESAQRNATVRCFANPDAHAHEDRTPSCSVSVEHGAWRCWGCGAHGGAYDAAIARGHTPASAIDLKIQHRLADRQDPAAASPRRRVAAASRAQVVSSPALRPSLAASEAEVSQWHEALMSGAASDRWELVARRRLWSLSVARELGLGHDGSRITIPIRNAGGELRGVLRYQPGATSHKMLAVPGTRLGLIPHPARERSARILLVEGPPDMIAARSQGWPAIAVPGDHAWQPGWRSLLEGRTVIVLMDCDVAGREAAERIAVDLRSVATVRVGDLAPSRRDGYDLTNWLLEQPTPRRPRCATSSSPKPTITR